MIKNSIYVLIKELIKYFNSHHSIAIKNMYHINNSVLSDVS